MGYAQAVKQAPLPQVDSNSHRRPPDAEGSWLFGHCVTVRHRPLGRSQVEVATSKFHSQRDNFSQYEEVPFIS
jgi:hypothetical protein